jgi:hypothetical protein
MLIWFESKYNFKKESGKVTKNEEENDHSYTEA